MFLVIDNYDSFVHNLARYFEIAGVKTKIVRNDAITLKEIKALKPEALILSPGPCTPKEAGICIEAVKTLGPTLPILGVCLGHQAIGEAYGALTLRAQTPVHGKSTTITHNAQELFKDLPSPLNVGRYHSLIVQLSKICPLVTDAQTQSGEIMALSHPAHPVYGVQFHPESVLTQSGQNLVNNFVELAKRWHSPDVIPALCGDPDARIKRA
ncbi:MAG: aminodeoxychorismate/anthranilate synthase component II [Rhodospirillales bacterium]|nr:aminodeoxychorismate/anthranilate synthase component II [Alphaproteobacteria bacterium]USO05849.1 MAG: aminodeoxychorismate/anthranilate synthase component II [Rhodospirillales bacterium]